MLTAPLWFILMLVLFSHNFPIANGSTCYSVNDCKTCVRKTTWNPFANCRWCPQDERCHTFGAIAANPCSRAENVKYVSGCGAKAGRYSGERAWKSAMLSAVAYSQDAKRFLPVAFPENYNNLTNVFQVKKSGYSGFTAVWPTERLIVIAFRGTVDGSQVIKEIVSVLTTPKVSFLGGEIQDYFLKGFNYLWYDEKLGKEVERLASAFPEYRILVTGHSLGGALASVASTFLAKRFESANPNRVLVYTFGMPRVGNHDYATVHDKLCRDSWRVTQASDPVVHLPSMVGINPLNVPYHHGKEIYYSERTTCGSQTWSYKRCDGILNNEDWTCSNSVTNWSKCWTVVATASCIDDHKNYFGIAVGTWWETAEHRSKLLRAKRSATECRRCELYCIKSNTTFEEIFAAAPTSAVNTCNRHTSCIWMIYFLIGLLIYFH